MKMVVTVKKKQSDRNVLKVGFSTGNWFLGPLKQDIRGYKNMSNLHISLQKILNLLYSNSQKIYTSGQIRCTSSYLENQPPFWPKISAILFEVVECLFVKNGLWAFA